MSSDFGFPTTFLGAPNLQNIMPLTNWGAITVNYQGNPLIETEIAREVASAGKQLGILTEALLALADHVGRPTEGEALAKIERVQDLYDRVEAVKAASRKATRDQIRGQMRSLAKIDPKAARRLADELKLWVETRTEGDDKV